MCWWVLWLLLETKTLVLQPLKHPGQVVEMLFRALSRDDDVIQVTAHSCQAI